MNPKMSSQSLPTLKPSDDAIYAAVEQYGWARDTDFQVDINFEEPKQCKPHLQSKRTLLIPLMKGRSRRHTRSYIATVPGPRPHPQSTMLLLLSSA